MRAPPTPLSEQLDATQQFFAELFDFTVYWTHRFYHEIPFLWKFHAIHHSTETLDWASGFRAHPFDGTLIAPAFILLVAEGYSLIEDIKQTTVDNISKIDGIDEKTAKELIDRAAEFLKKDAEEISKKIKELGVAEDLINLKGLSQGMLVTLGEQKILNLKDFAELASDELIGGYDIIKGEKVKIKGYLEDFALTKKEADDLIMSARNIVY